MPAVSAPAFAAGADLAAAMGQQPQQFQGQPSPQMQAQLQSQGQLPAQEAMGAEWDPAQDPMPASAMSSAADAVRSAQAVAAEWADDLKAAGRAVATRTAGAGEAHPVRKKRSVVGVVVVSVVAVIALACAAFVAFLAWDRWGAYDDAADMQGIWQANGSASTVVVDGEQIQLTDDVAYDYEIDPFAKTITFSLGNMEGQGRYRFSPDRTQLVITDGTGYSWLSTLMDDIPWRVQSLQDELAGVEGAGKEASSGEEDGRTILDRP